MALLVLNLIVVLAGFFLLITRQYPAPSSTCSSAAITGLIGGRPHRLRPEPPLTHTPRLHEHDASAQAPTGTSDLNCVPEMTPSPLHHHPRPAGSGRISDPAIV